MLSELYRGCRTFRKFTQEPLPKSVLMMAMDNVRIASCAGNRQELRYVVVVDPQIVAMLQPLVKWAGYLPVELGTPKKGEQPTAFVAVVKKKGAAPIADIDVGIAVNTLTTSLWESGIGSCIMGSIDREKIKQILNIDAEETLSLMVAMGFPAHESYVVEMGDSIKYRLTPDGDYLVPKRAFSDVIEFR